MPCRRSGHTIGAEAHTNAEPKKCANSGARATANKFLGAHWLLFVTHDCPIIVESGAVALWTSRWCPQDFSNWRENQTARRCAKVQQIRRGCPYSKQAAT